MRAKRKRLLIYPHLSQFVLIVPHFYCGLVRFFVFVNLSFYNILYPFILFWAAQNVKVGLKSNCFQGDLHSTGFKAHLPFHCPLNLSLHIGPSYKCL